MAVVVDGDGMLPRKTFHVTGAEYVTFVIGVVVGKFGNVEGCGFDTSIVRLDINRG